MLEYRRVTTKRNNKHWEHWVPFQDSINILTGQDLALKCFIAIMGTSADACLIQGYPWLGG